MFSAFPRKGKGIPTIYFINARLFLLQSRHHSDKIQTGRGVGNGAGVGVADKTPLGMPNPRSNGL